MRLIWPPSRGLGLSWPVGTPAPRPGEAGLNQAEVTGCWVAGDEVELVVTVDTAVAAGAGPWRVTLRGHANAGVLTGAPEQVG